MSYTRFLIECWLDLYVRTMSVYIEKLRKEWATWACSAWIGFVIQANYGQEFLFLNEIVTGDSAPDGMTWVTGVYTPNGESNGSFRSWWREFLLWVSLPFLTLDLLRMVVPALLLGYKDKSKTTFSLLSLLRALDIHAYVVAKSSRLSSCKHGNRENRPPKPASFVSSSARIKTHNQVFGEWLRDCSIVQQPHPLPGIRGDSRRLALQPLCTASSRTTAPTGAMSTSATGSGAAGYVVVHPLFSAIKIMIISIVYMFLTLRSHVHMSDVTNILIIYFFELNWYWNCLDF
jgi:hypothetical protein